MEEILFGSEGVEISVDDVIVHAVTIDQLIIRLRKVFERCRERNLKLNPKKCEFGITEIPVLGHVVSAKGIQPDPGKTKAIQEAPPPANVAELRSFLGVYGYVSKFIPNYANLVEPLRRLTRQNVRWTWGKEQIKSFEELKRALSNEPFLACFRLYCPTVLVTDASPVGLGGVLLQEQITGNLKPVAYISRSLTPTEMRYSQIEREALACVWATERFHNYIFGIEFTLLTDNRPLVSLLSLNCQKLLPPRIQRLAWRLHQYRYEIKYIEGKMNIADSFSRLLLNELHETSSGNVANEYVKFIVENNMPDNCPLLLSEVREETAKDKTLIKIMNLVHSGAWSVDADIKPFEPFREEFSVYDGILLRGDALSFQRLFKTNFEACT